MKQKCFNTCKKILKLYMLLAMLHYKPSKNRMCLIISTKDQVEKDRK